MIDKQAAHKAPADIDTQGQLLDLVGSAVMVSRTDGRIAFWNRAAADLFGWSAHEAMGKLPREFVVSEASLPLAVEARSRAESGGHWRGEMLLLKRDGAIFPARVTVSPVLDRMGELVAMIAIADDVTEEKRASDELREEQDRFRQLAENIHEVFWLRDAGKDRVIYVSPGFESIWGRPCADLYANPAVWWDAVHDEDKAQVRRAMKQADATYDETYRIRRPDGSTRWVHDRAFPIRDASGQVYRVAGFAEDVTNYRRLEEELLQAQKLEAIGQLAGGVAHDFNNLLTVILGYTDLLLREKRVAGIARQRIKDVHAAGQKAMQLTQQLLAFSRRQVLAPKVVDLNCVVLEIERLLRRLIAEDVDLMLDLLPDVGFVRVDPGQFEQVLVNLTANARDAMPRGGSLTIATRNAVLDAHEIDDLPAGAYVVLSVRDTGVGIDAATQERIFDPFFTTKEPGRGTGLGLATVFGIVKQSGGHIAVGSKPGGGTTFSIYLPRVAGPLSADAPETAPGTVPGGSGTLLLAEDNENVRKIASEALNLAGYTVLQAANGREALELARQYAGPIDLLISDLVMPRLSGPGLAQELRRAHPETKVLFMTGHAEEDIARHGLTASGHAFLKKPFFPAQLVHAVHEVLGET